jgi:hypothetical protein
MHRGVFLLALFVPLGRETKQGEVRAILVHFQQRGSFLQNESNFPSKKGQIGPGALLVARSTKVRAW